MEDRHKKLLIAYATRCGSTAEVAQAIAKELISRNHSVDVRAAKEVSSLAGYDGVIVGSAVRFASWLPEAVAFVTSQKAALSSIPTAYFTVHILNLGSDAASQNARQAYLTAARAQARPFAEAFFAGQIDESKLSFVERIMNRIVKSPQGDLRDWEKIRAWGQAVFA